LIRVSSNCLLITLLSCHLAKAYVCVIDALPGTGGAKILSASGRVWLIYTINGLYRFDPITSDETLIKTNDASRQPILIFDVHRFGDGWLVGTESGVFTLDDQATALVLVSDLQTGRVESLGDFGDKGAFVAGDKGLYYVRSPNDRWAKVEGIDVGGTTTAKKIEGFGYLIGGTRGLFVLDLKDAKISQILGAVVGSVAEVSYLEGGWLVTSSNGLFFLKDPNDKLVRIQANFSNFIRVVRSMKNGGWLIGTDGGLYILSSDLKLSKASDRTLDSVSSIVHMATGDWLYATLLGLYQSKSDGNHYKMISEVGEGQPTSVEPLSNSDWVVGVNPGGLFRIGKDNGSIQRVNGAPDSVYSILSLPAGDKLVTGSDGLYRIDQNGDKLSLIPGVNPGGLWDSPGQTEEWPLERPLELTGAAVLPDHDLLVGSLNGLYRVVKDFANASTSLLQYSYKNNQVDKITAITQWSLTHRCAPVADKLGLAIEVSPVGGTTETQQVPSVGISVFNIEVVQNKITFNANIDLPGTGQWRLQLLESRAGNRYSVGEPIVISVPKRTELAKSSDGHDMEEIRIVGGDGLKSLSTTGQLTLNGNSLALTEVDAAAETAKIKVSPGELKDGLNFLATVSNTWTYWYENHELQYFANPYKSSFAIIAAIDDYKRINDPEHRPPTGERQLKNMVDGARKLRDVLVNIGFPAENIVELYDNRATADNITRELYKFWPGGIHAGADRLFVYFGGHGGSTNGFVGTGYLVTYDFEMGKPQTGFLMNNFMYSHFPNIDARTVMVALDACSAGFAIPQMLSTAADEKELRKFATLAEMRLQSTKKARNLLVAGTGDEPAVDYGGGIFTQALVNGLEGNADLFKDRVIQFDLLSLYVQRVVESWAQALGMVQEPRGFVATGPGDQFGGKILFPLSSWK
jgi:Caspase domain